MSSGITSHTPTSITASTPATPKGVNHYFKKTGAMVASVASKASQASKVFTTPVKVWGINCNPTSKVLQTCRVISSESTIFATTQNKLSHLRTLVDERLGATQPLADTTQPLHPLVNNEIPNSAPLHRRELELRTSLIDHLINFSLITWFDKKIYGGQRFDRTNPLQRLTAIEYYRNLASAQTIVHSDNQAKQAMRLYFDQLYNENKFYYYLAATIIPIAKWFSLLLLNPEHSHEGGITYFQDVIRAYLRDPANTRSEIVFALHALQEYFSKLNRITESFEEAKKNSQHPDHHLSKAEYLTKKLQEDLIANNQNPIDLSKQFNRRIVKLLNPKSGLFLIGFLVDKVAKKLLLIIMDNLNPIETLLQTGFGQNRLNVNFAYSIVDKITGQLRNIKDLLVANASRKPTIGHTMPPQVACPSSNLTEEETAIIKRFIEEFLKYLPSELGKDFVNNGVIDTQILEYTKRMALDLYGLMTRETNNQEVKLKLWNDLLSITCDLFTQPSIVRSSDDYLAIRQQSKETVQDLISTAYSIYAQDLPYVSKESENQEKACLIYQKLLNDAEELAEKIENIKTFEQNQALLFEIKKHITKLQLLFNEVPNLQGLSYKQKELIASFVNKQCLVLENFTTENLTISQQLNALAINNELYKILIEPLPMENHEGSAEFLTTRVAHDSHKISRLSRLLLQSELHKSSLTTETLTLIDNAGKIYTLNQQRPAFICVENNIVALHESVEALQEEWEKMKVLHDVEIQLNIIRQELTKSKTNRNIDIVIQAFNSLNRLTEAYPLLKNSLKHLDTLSQATNFDELKSLTSQLKGLFNFWHTFYTNENKVNRYETLSLQIKERLKEIENQNLFEPEIQEIMQEQRRHCYATESELNELAGIIELLSCEYATRLAIYEQQLNIEQHLLKKGLEDYRFYLEGIGDQLNTEVANYYLSASDHLQELIQSEDLPKGFAINLGSQLVMKAVQKILKPKIEQITTGLIEVSLNPLHRRELLFRGVICQNGPLTRIEGFAGI